MQHSTLNTWNFVYVLCYNTPRRVGALSLTEGIVRPIDGWVLAASQPP